MSLNILHCVAHSSPEYRYFILNDHYTTMHYASFAFFIVYDILGPRGVQAFLLYCISGFSYFLKHLQVISYILFIHVLHHALYVHETWIYDSFVVTAPRPRCPALSELKVVSLSPDRGPARRICIASHFFSFGSREF